MTSEANGGHWGQKFQFSQFFQIWGNRGNDFVDDFNTILSRISRILSILRILSTSMILDDFDIFVKFSTILLIFDDIANSIFSSFHLVELITRNLNFRAKIYFYFITQFLGLILNQGRRIKIGQKPCPQNNPM